MLDMYFSILVWNVRGLNSLSGCDSRKVAKLSCFFFFYREEEPHRTPSFIEETGSYTLLLEWNRVQKKQDNSATFLESKTKPNQRVWSYKPPTKLLTYTTNELSRHIKTNRHKDYDLLQLDFPGVGLFEFFTRRGWRWTSCIYPPSYGIPDMLLCKKSPPQVVSFP
jgi:hypothetical protein